MIYSEVSPRPHDTGLVTLGRGKSADDARYIARAAADALTVRLS